MGDCQGCNKCKRCKECLAVVEKMGHMTPVGYSPFGWGDINGDDLDHFYVFSEDTPACPKNCAQELGVIKICDIENPQIREAALLDG